MAPDQEHSGRRRWPLVLGAVAIVGGGLVAANLLVNSDDPQSLPSATTAPPIEPSPTPTGLVVEAGGGGSTVADVDGVTPMGYEDTCEGAVAAATNQWLALEDAPDGWWTEEGLARHAELVAYFAPGEVQGGWQTRYKEERASAAEAVVEHGAEYTQTDLDAALGAFRVVSCTPAQATIDVISGAVLTADGQESPAYGSVRVTVSWIGDGSGAEADWVIREAEELPISEDPATDVQPSGEFTAETRAALLVAGGPGWTEYSNARP